MARWPRSACASDAPWDANPADPEAIALARDLVERVPASGWRHRTLAAASASALADANRWRGLFPPRVARCRSWFVSTVSDASMQQAFSAVRAPAMSAVIIERLDQNRDLKPFVRQVMLFGTLSTRSRPRPAWTAPRG